MKAKKEELFIAVFAVFILLTISSSLLYYVEHDAQPEAFSSIPSAMWWGVGCALVFNENGLAFLIWIIVFGSFTLKTFGITI